MPADAYVLGSLLGYVWSALRRDAGRRDNQKILFSLVLLEVWLRNALSVPITA